jgi:hypothetical protein
MLIWRSLTNDLCELYLFTRSRPNRKSGISHDSASNFDGIFIPRSHSYQRYVETEVCIRNQ